MKPDKSLQKVLMNYSDVAILNFFKAANPATQIDQEFQNDPSKKFKLINDISNKLIEFRDVFTDLSDINNQEKVHGFMTFFYGSDYNNSQYRGLQYSLASKVDFSKLNNVLSPIVFGCSQPLNTKLVEYVPRVSTPANYLLAGHNSFKQGNELLIANIHFSITGYKNTLTDDQPVLYKNNVKPIIKNHNQKNHDSETSYSIVQNDIKVMPLTKVVSQSIGNKDSGKIVSVGAKETDKDIKLLALAAQNSIKISKIGHIDPKKHNDLAIKTQILKKVEISGQVSDTKDLTGFPFIINSEFTKNPND